MKIPWIIFRHFDNKTRFIETLLACSASQWVCASLRICPFVTTSIIISLTQWNFMLFLFTTFSNRAQRRSFGAAAQLPSTMHIRGPPAVFYQLSKASCPSQHGSSHARDENVRDLSEGKFVHKFSAVVHHCSIVSAEAKVTGSVVKYVATTTSYRKEVEKMSNKFWCQQWIPVRKLIVWLVHKAMTQRITTVWRALSLFCAWWWWER